ncbi:MAG: hypothetical protein AAFZ18_29145 [Myxococcota bacterium]
MTDGPDLESEGPDFYRAPSVEPGPAEEERFSVLSDHLLGPIQLVRLGVEVGFQAPGWIIGLTLLIGLPINLGLELLLPEVGSLGDMVRAFRVNALLETWLGSLRDIGVIFVVGRVVAGERPGLLAVLSTVLRRYLPVVGYRILLKVVLGFLALLLVVPAVIFWVFWLFVDVRLVLRPNARNDAPTASRMVVEGRWFRVAGTALVTQLGWFVVVMIVSTPLSLFIEGMSDALPARLAVSFIVDVLAVLAVVTLTLQYLNLEAVPPAEGFDPTSTSTNPGAGLS